MIAKFRQPWIYSTFVDGLFILFPPFLPLLLIILFPGYFNETSEVNTLWWIILVVWIDVAHVYSTLYRTYFDSEAFSLQKSTFIYVPLFAWVSGVVLYSIDAMLFWRILAYLAVFHFIKQQYGFLRIYSRKEASGKAYRLIDTVAIYSATIYPILYWHLSPDREFDWFIKGDFIQYKSEILIDITSLLYTAIILIYIIKEILLTRRAKEFNIPRNLVIVGTSISWYFGIVFYNGDLLFTLFNVVSHGIPYMALIWIYGRKTYFDSQDSDRKFLRITFSNIGLILFILIILGLAFIEEGIWDAAVWKEHTFLFSFLSFIPKITDHHFLSFIIPLLALPQVTHYILDGFIWKINNDKFKWKEKTLST